MAVLKYLVSQLCILYQYCVNPVSAWSPISKQGNSELKLIVVIHQNVRIPVLTGRGGYMIHTSRMQPLS